MIEALRLAQERVTAAAPPHEVEAETADLLDKLTATPANGTVGYQNCLSAVA